MHRSPQSHPVGIIFDLDGTLIDSAPDITACINTCFAARGWPQLSVDYVAEHIGHGTRRLVQDLLHTLKLPCDTAILDAAVADYLAAYYRHPVRHTRLFPHVEEDLQAFTAAGIRLGICTNKQQSLSEQILHALGIAQQFAVVVGGDAVPACKPNPGHLLATAERMELDSGNWVYVGDSHIDLSTAQAAGIPFYAVPWSSGAQLPVTPAYRLTRLRDLLN